MNIEELKRSFAEYLEEKNNIYGAEREPGNLYEPIDYILKLGGKKLRPILTLLSCDIFKANYKNALDAALAIEMFHNFTLMHDDIMDEAPLRRGKTTVHHKWNVNTGILSGDAMLILAYQFFESYDAKTYKKLVSLFNKTALEVCEGQQMDMDFESRGDVTLPEYITMIKFKTAVLVACALKMGAIIAEADENDAELIYDFGINLGLAFQLQDDYLDTFGSEDFGKQIGGDILENKKTFLAIKLFELASDKDKETVIEWFSNNKKTGEKVQAVTNLYRKYGVDKDVRSEIESYTLKAFKNIEDLNIDISNKQVLIDFGNSLMKRKL